jgi:hypothetical protein
MTAFGATLEMIRQRRADLGARAAQTAGGGYVFLDNAIDLDGNEADGLAEFDRRETEMRQAGTLKPGDVLVGIVLVAAPLRDPEMTRREEQRAAASIRAYETERAPAASTAAPQATRPRGFGPGDHLDGWPTGGIA